MSDKEDKRKCFKCGASPAEDGVKLFRFAKPGTRNLLRCELWAKYIFPEREYSSIELQRKLYTEHRNLCERHFKDEDFTDSTKKRLVRNAVPYDEQEAPAIRTYSSVGHIMQRSALGDISNLPLPRPSMPGQSISKPNAQEPCVSGPSMPGPSMSVPSTQEPPVPGSTTKEARSSHPGALSSLREHQLLTKCRKYMNKVCQLQHRLKNYKKKDQLNAVSEDKAVKKLSKKITPAFALLLQAQLKNVKRKMTGRRWSQEEKITALRIYKRSPTCYRLLRRLFPLPSPSTLKTLLRRLPFGVGVNEPIFKVLKDFVANQAPGDNYYILMFDEMSIKKHLEYNPKDDIIEGYQDHGSQGRSPVEATYALVFMIAGIRKRVKQPIAHYFSSGYSTADRLAVLIKEVLLQCFKAGINIVATVCDMDGVNRRALTILGSTLERPRILFESKEIITFFDTPHLLKCFRNLFIKYDIDLTTSISSDGKVGKGIAKWSHIKQFQEVDSTNRNFVYAPVLTKEHLDPNAKQKMKVNLAAQVLSHSVAGGMFARVSNGEIPSEAAVTASMVSDIDKLFDLLNADTQDLRRGKPHSTNWSPTSPHEVFLRKMKTFFEEMKFVGSPRRPPSQDGWITTINAFLLLRKKLEAANIRTLATRRVQQDAIENLFGCIRGNCGANTNPTCNQFVAGLKTAILSNLSHMGTKGNCETDNITIMNNMNTFLSVSQPIIPNLEVEIYNDLPQVGEDDMVENNAEIQACAYVCGFIVKKTKECENCKNIFISKNIEAHHLFVECREYTDKKKSLNYVSAPMVTCVETCATATNHILKENGHKNALKQLVKENIKAKVNFDFLLGCGEHRDWNIEHIINSVFYICIKRFCILKNRSFSSEASAAALKRKMKIIVHK